MNGLLLVSEAAERLRMSCETVLRYISVGRLQAYRMGHRYLLSWEHIQEFLRRRETPLVDRVSMPARSTLQPPPRSVAEIERKADA